MLETLPPEDTEMGYEAIKSLCEIIASKLTCCNSRIYI